MRSSYSKGEIVNINLGNPPDGTKGHEENKERPCVIIRALNNLQLIIVLPCTSKEKKYNEYTSVKLLAGKGNLRCDSFVLCHQIRSVSFDRINNIVGVLDQTDLLKIQTVLIDTLEI